eukprot:m.264166 g.264166  ORF g.264166 m.264166 type:complete len:364 (+) comp27648_c0_seq1:75-1166(+)
MHQDHRHQREHQHHNDATGTPYMLAKCGAAAAAIMEPSWPSRYASGWMPSQPWEVAPQVERPRAPAWPRLITTVFGSGVAAWYCWYASSMADCLNRPNGMTTITIEEGAAARTEASQPSTDAVTVASGRLLRPSLAPCAMKMASGAGWNVRGRPARIWFHDEALGFPGVKTGGTLPLPAMAQPRRPYATTDTSASRPAARENAHVTVAALEPRSPPGWQRAWTPSVMESPYAMIERLASVGNGRTLAPSSMTRPVTVRIAALSEFRCQRSALCRLLNTKTSSVCRSFLRPDARGIVVLARGGTATSFSGALSTEYWRFMNGFPGAIRVSTARPALVPVKLTLMYAPLFDVSALAGLERWAQLC